MLKSAEHDVVFEVARDLLMLVPPSEFCQRGIELRDGMPGMIAFVEVNFVKARDLRNQWVIQKLEQDVRLDKPTLLSVVG